MARTRVYQDDTQWGVWNEFAQEWVKVHEWKFTREMIMAHTEDYPFPDSDKWSIEDAIDALLGEGDLLIDGSKEQAEWLALFVSEHWDESDYT